MFNFDFKTALERSKNESITISLFNEEMLEELGHAVFEDFIYSKTSFLMLGHVNEDVEKDVWFGMSSLNGLFNIMKSNTFNLYYDKEKEDLFFIWEDGEQKGAHIIREWSEDYYDNLLDEISIGGKVYKNVKDVPFLKDIEDTGVITENIMNEFLKYTISAKDSLEKELWIDK